MAAKVAKAVRYRGAFFAGLDYRQEGEPLTRIHKLDDWTEALPMASPVIVLVLDEISKNERKEGEGHILNLDTARATVIGLIEELEKAGDPVAKRLSELLDELVEEQPPP